MIYIIYCLIIPNYWQAGQGMKQIKLITAVKELYNNKLEQLNNHTIP